MKVNKRVNGRVTKMEMIFNDKESVKKNILSIEKQLNIENGIEKQKTNGGNELW